MTMTPQDTIKHLEDTIKHLEDMIRLLEAALEFYADSKNWQSPSSGFALQYDPQSPEVQRDRGRRALLALAKNKGVLG
jgi:hypothetical protein